MDNDYYKIEICCNYYLVFSSRTYCLSS